MSRLWVEFDGMFRTLRALVTDIVYNGDIWFDCEIFIYFYIQIGLLDLSQWCADQSGSNIARDVVDGQVGVVRFRLNGLLVRGRGHNIIFILSDHPYTPLRFFWVIILLQVPKNALKRPKHLKKFRIFSIQR